MIGLIERAVFGPPAPIHPLTGWVCVECDLPLLAARSFHQHCGYLICGRCAERLEREGHRLTGPQGSVAGHPLRGWWCARCERPLVTATSVFREGDVYVCGGCEERLQCDRARAVTPPGPLPGDEYLYLD